MASYNSFDPRVVISLLEEINKNLVQLVETVKKPADNSLWMNIEECSAYTKIPEATIRDYVYKEIMPFSRPKGTRLVRFYKPAIDSWMASYKSKGRLTHKIDLKGFLT